MPLHSFRNILAGTALAVVATVGAVPAFAGVIVDFSVSPLGGDISYMPNGALGDATSISGLTTIQGYYADPKSDDTTGISQGMTAITSIDWPAGAFSYTQGSQTLTTPITESFAGAGGTYTASFSTLFVQSTPGSTSVAWVLEGTLTLPDSETQAIYLSAAFTNVSNANTAATNVSFTETSSPPPAINTPEPVSIALLGVGMAGLATTRRRTRTA